MCCCCGATPNQSHLALTINSGILLLLFTIMACVMVSSTNDYKAVKLFIEAQEQVNKLEINYSRNLQYPSSIGDINIESGGVSISTNANQISIDMGLYVDPTTNYLKYAKWFKNLKGYEMGIIITRLIVIALIFGCLIFECILENKKTLPTSGVLYNIFIGVYIFQIVFHVIFAILSIVLGIAELLAILQYGLLLPSGAKISGPILKRGATQIAFTGFFFVYQLVFVCLVVPIFGMFRRKELVGQGFDPYKKGASNSATSREINPGSQNVIKQINE